MSVCRAIALLATITFASPLCVGHAWAQPPSPRPPIPAESTSEQPPDPQEPTPADDPAQPDEQRPLPRPGLGVRPRLFGLFGFQSFTATDSFSAVLDTSTGVFLGGGGGVLLGPNVFVDVSLSRFAADGTRVFVTDAGEIVDLGIATDVTVMPIDVSVGWRMPGKPSLTPSGKPRLRPVPFAGGGFGFQQYKETSEFSSGEDDVDESNGSYHVLGGVELPFSQRFGAIADVLYRWVPDAIGTAGISAQYDETDLGGLQVRVRVAVGF